MVSAAVNQEEIAVAVNKPIIEIDKATLDEIVRRIRSIATPEKIILFGSAVHGRMTPDSDIDLLIIEPDSADRRKEYVLIRRALRDIAYSFDIVLVTSEYFESTKEVIGGIAYPAHTEGRVLYAAA
jgi:predicted nucleotidyltransferase